LLFPANYLQGTVADHLV